MLLASKLIMGTKKIPPEYVTENLLRKVENDVFGSSLQVPPTSADYDMRDQRAGFTYCGTLPVLTTVAYLLNIWKYSAAIQWAKDASDNYHIIWRNQMNGESMTPSNVDTSLVSNLTVQPYIQATFRNSTEITTQQVVTLSVEDIDRLKMKATLSNTGVFAHTNYNYINVGFQSAAQTTPLDLGLVYDRVLTADELQQNYEAFAYNHRRV